MSGRDAMKKLLDAAEPLAKVLWRNETEGKDFSTPERRAGLERNLAEIVSQIGDNKIADYYRRDFEQKVFEAFKRRPQTRRDFQDMQRGGRRRDAWRRDSPPPPGLNAGEAVSSQVKATLFARSGKDAARRMKERELVTLLFLHPELAATHGETLADLVFLDRSLDSFRHELLNLAASGSRLERQALEAHFGRSGQADLVERLSSWAARITVSDDTHGPDARFQAAVDTLKGMAEGRPALSQAVERFKIEGTEESWSDAARLLGNRSD